MYFRATINDANDTAKGFKKEKMEIIVSLSSGFEI